MLKIILLFLLLIIPLVSDEKLILELDPKKQNILVIHPWHDILWDRLWCKGLNNVLSSDFYLIRYGKKQTDILAKQLVTPLSDFYTQRVMEVNKMLLLDESVVAIHVEDFETKKTFIFEYKVDGKYLSSLKDLSIAYKNYLSYSADIIYLGKK